MLYKIIKVQYFEFQYMYYIVLHDLNWCWTLSHVLSTSREFQMVDVYIAAPVTEDKASSINLGQRWI